MLRRHRIFGRRNKRVPPSPASHFFFFFSSCSFLPPPPFPFPPPVLLRFFPLDIHHQDKLCGVYLAQAAQQQGPGAPWSREYDRTLLIGLLKHGSGRFQAIVQDDTLGLRPALELALSAGELQYSASERRLAFALPRTVWDRQTRRTIPPPLPPAVQRVPDLVFASRWRWGVVSCLVFLLLAVRGSKSSSRVRVPAWLCLRPRRCPPPGGVRGTGGLCFDRRWRRPRRPSYP